MHLKNNKRVLNFFLMYNKMYNAYEKKKISICMYLKSVKQVCKMFILCTTKSILRVRKIRHVFKKN